LIFFANFIKTAKFAVRNTQQKFKNITLNKDKEMKKGIHPETYRHVAFKDMSNGHTFITKSTVNTKEDIEIDGVTYPLVKIEISNTSHPYYTGKMKLVDSAGRVDKFKKRYAQHITKGNE
jgi:large subunit ribosomal protein L31